MAGEEGKLETKLTQLTLAAQRTEKILDSGKQEAIERHLKGLKATISEADQHKRAVEASKIDDKQEIGDWNAEVETKIGIAEDEVNRIQKWLDSRILEKETSVREEKFQFEVKLEEAKLEMQAKVQAQAGLKSAESAVSKSGASECTPVKLPKIDIVKFDGAYMDWPRFWGQFTETVDRSNIPAINKFTYLCGFLGPKVRRRVESLPFTPEGYNRAKAILQDQYGKNSEIVKAYIKEIMDLPQIPGVNAKKIADFSEKLSYSVQALETLGKLRDVQGNVSMTLDKLSGIRGDLVRNDPEWESWDFVKLAEAIRQWIRRNPIHERETETQSGKSSPGRLGKAFHAKAAKMCVYCEGEHRTGDCTVVLDVSKRREILAKKKLCFNCAAGQHRANSCPSKSTCRKCNKRHHTTICDTSDKGWRNQR